MSHVPNPANTVCTMALILWFAGVGVASAQQGNVGESKERFKRGLMFVDEGDCRKAILEFEESYKLYPTAVALYNIALCYDNLHQYAKALKYYKQFMAESKKMPPKQKAMLDQRIATLEGFLGTLTVTSNVDSAIVIIDDEEVGVTPLENYYVETGEHSIVVKKEKFQEFRTNVKVVSGKTSIVEAQLKPEEEEGKEPKEVGEPFPGASVGSSTEGGTQPMLEEVSPRRKLQPRIFYWMLGTSVALTGGAAVIGTLNLLNYNKFKKTPYWDPKNPERVNPDWQPLKERGERYNYIFLALAGAAGAAIITTVVLGVFTNFRGEEEPEEGRKWLSKEDKKKRKARSAVPGPAALYLLPQEGGGFFVAISMPFST